jgi:hypothetical protein
MYFLPITCGGHAVSCLVASLPTAAPHSLQIPQSHPLLLSTPCSLHLGCPPCHTHLDSSVSFALTISNQ